MCGRMGQRIGMSGLYFGGDTSTVGMSFGACLVLDQNPCVYCYGVSPVFRGSYVKDGGILLSRIRSCAIVEGCCCESQDIVVKGGTRISVRAWRCGSSWMQPGEIGLGPLSGVR